MVNGGISGSSPKLGEVAPEATEECAGASRSLFRCARACAVASHTPSPLRGTPSNLEGEPEIVSTAGFRSVGKWDFKLKSGFPAIRKCRHKLKSGFPAVRSLRHGLKSRFRAVRSLRMKSCAGFRGDGSLRHGLKFRFPAVRSRRMKSCAGFPAVRSLRLNSCAGFPAVRRCRCRSISNSSPKLGEVARSDGGVCGYIAQPIRYAWAALWLHTRPPPFGVLPLT